LEPASFLSVPNWTRYYFGVSVVSYAADLMVLYAVFYSLEDGLPAFGSARAWLSTALLSGMLFCFAAELPIPAKARGVQIAWLTAEQAFTYIRALGLIALSLYGWLRASSWPRDLAWTWIGMAVYGITDVIVTRIQLLQSNTNLLDLATTTAAMLQLAGWWFALSHVPKPLTALDMESASNTVSIPNN